VQSHPNEPGASEGRETERRPQIPNHPLRQTPVLGRGQTFECTSVGKVRAGTRLRVRARRGPRSRVDGPVHAQVTEVGSAPVGCCPIGANAAEADRLAVECGRTRPWYALAHPVSSTISAAKAWTVRRGAARPDVMDQQRGVTAVAPGSTRNTRLVGQLAPTSTPTAAQRARAPKCARRRRGIRDQLAAKSAGRPGLPPTR